MAMPMPVASSGDTSKSPLWIVMIFGLLVLAVAGWWFYLRPASQAATPVTDVATTVVIEEAADAVKDAAETVAEDHATPATASGVVTENSAGEEITAVDIVGAETQAQAVKPADASKEAVQRAIPAANSRAKVPEIFEKPVARSLPKPSSVTPERTAAQPQLKFIPVDPQVARNLPPPPRSSQGMTASPAPEMVPQVQTAVAAASTPEQACGRRVFLAMTMCMQRQCETPQFASHPQCVQLRQQNQNRQNEVNQGR